MPQGRVLQYHSFAVANFLAAFGGGMILGKGIGVINTPFLQGGSLVAFFVGGVLGLIFLHSVPEKLSKSLARWFSIGGGLTSLILLSIFENYAVNGKLTSIAAALFFFLLSIRFGFWFYSRVIRASATAGQKQRIAWVELGYYVGMIFGLIIWKFIGIDIALTTALMIDAALQFSAGFLDLRTSQLLITQLHSSQPTEQTTITASNKNDGAYDKMSGWRLAFSVVFLTVGVQAVIFNLTHHVAEYFSSFIIAAFYFGASIAAIICKKHKIQLDWKQSIRQDSAYAKIYTGKMGENKSSSYLLIGITSAFFVTLSVFGANYWLTDSPVVILNLQWGEIFLLLCIFCSAFFYEILALAILDRIGLEEQYSNHKGMIIRTYGLMGIGAAISLWIFGLTNSSLLGLLFTLIVCLLVSILTVWKRNLSSSPLQNVAAYE